MPAPPTLLFLPGTRAEAIKLAPLVLAARAHGGFTVRVCVTAGQRAMLNGVLAFFHIRPDFELAPLSPAQTPGVVIAAVLAGVAPVLAAIRPSWAVVQGDTTGAFAAALACGHAGVRVAHVGPGSGHGADMNRKLVGAIASLHFAPNAAARSRLLRDGVNAAHMLVTGSTGIDALFLAREWLRLDPACRAQARAALALHGLERFMHPARRFVLVTAQGRDSMGVACDALGSLCARYPAVDFVLAAQPDGAARRRARPLAGNLVLSPPLDYLPFVALMAAASLLLTDSTGVLQEAASLGKQGVLMPATGASLAGIVDAAVAVLDADLPDASPSQLHGDGRAARRIVDAFERFRDGACGTGPVPAKH